MAPATSQPRALRFLQRGLLALAAGVTWLALTSATANADEPRMSSAVPLAPTSAISTMIQLPKADDPIAPTAPATSPVTSPAPAPASEPAAPPAISPALPVEPLPVVPLLPVAQVDPVQQVVEAPAPAPADTSPAPIVEQTPVPPATEPAPVPPVIEPAPAPPVIEPAPAPSVIEPAPAPDSSSGPAPDPSPGPVPPAVDPVVPAGNSDPGTGSPPVIQPAPDPSLPASAPLPGTPAATPAAVPPLLGSKASAGKLAPAPHVLAAKSGPAASTTAPVLTALRGAGTQSPGISAGTTDEVSAEPGYASFLVLPEARWHENRAAGVSAGSRAPAAPRPAGEGTPTVPGGGDNGSGPRGGDTGLPAPVTLPATPGSGSGSGSTSSGPSGAAAWTPGAFLLIPPTGTDPISGPLQHVHPAVAADPGSSPD